MKENYIDDDWRNHIDDQPYKHDMHCLVKIDELHNYSNSPHHTDDLQRNCDKYYSAGIV